MLAKRWHENCNVSLTQPNKSSKKENIICMYVHTCVRACIYRGDKYRDTFRRLPLVAKWPFTTRLFNPPSESAFPRPWVNENDFGSQTEGKSNEQMIGGQSLLCFEWGATSSLRNEFSPVRNTDERRIYPHLVFQIGVRGERPLPWAESRVNQPGTVGPRHESVRRASVQGLRCSSWLRSSAGASLAPFGMRMRGACLGRGTPQGEAFARAQFGRKLGRQERGSVQLWNQYG